MNRELFKHLKADAPAGLVVFLVALPLCLGIALASGAPLFSGIIAGMIGGIVVTLFSGSSLGVSGPAAGLAVIVFAAIQDLGSFETFLVAVIIAGIIQVILGILKAGVIGHYFPSSVIKGMLSAIGIIIFIKQIPLALGISTTIEGSIDIGTLIDLVTPGAIIISATSLAILLLWEQKFMKRLKLFQIIQGPLVAVVAGILLDKLLTGTPLEITDAHLVNIPVSDDIRGFFSQFNTPDFSAFTNSKVWIIGLTIAIVASLETLLCVEATDKLDTQKRVTPTNKELIAQGIGNMVAGMIGGLPITQVMARSSANIQSGGQTKTSAFIHGILIFFAALTIPNVLNMIPVASLAAILLIVGYKLAKPVLFVDMYQKGWLQFIPYIVTIVAIIFTDLLIGIGVGMAVALFNNFILKPKNGTGRTSIINENDSYYRLTLPEQLTFLNKAQILRALKKIPNNSNLCIDASQTIFIEYDVLEILSDFKNNAKPRMIDVQVIQPNHINL